MFEIFSASKRKGDKIINILTFANYGYSVTRDNDLLAQMCQMRERSEGLKEGR